MELFRATAESIEDYYEKKALSSGKHYNRKTVKNLILDVVTHWNLVYLMLERALEFSEVSSFATVPYMHSFLTNYFSFHLGY